ncbi:hypothetical protein D9M69_664100 [compost metagenome]
MKTISTLRHPPPTSTIRFDTSVKTEMVKREMVKADRSKAKLILSPVVAPEAKVHPFEEPAAFA